MSGRGRGRPPHPGILTPAEQRVLDELRGGGTNVEIAVRLGLSPETVKTHIASMLGKLGLDDRHALASWRPDRERPRVLGLLVLRPARASLGRLFLWAGAALGGMAITVAVVVLLAAVLGGAEDDHIVLSPTGVVSCDSGVAVPDSNANTELVGDCEILLALKDRLAGTATLNWTAGKAMSEWSGVTIAGTPQRVTKLELASSGLTGEIPPQLGDLTALTDLRLNNNQLSGEIPPSLGSLTNITQFDVSRNSLIGRVPSSLSQYTGLRFVYLAYNSFTGCVPYTWEDTYAGESSSRNDLEAADLDYCDAPANTSQDNVDLEGGQSFSFQLREQDPVVTFDLPENYTYEVWAEVGSSDVEGAPSMIIAIVIHDEDGNMSWVAVDAATGEEWYRWINGVGGLTRSGERHGGPTNPGGQRNPMSSSPLDSVFDEIVESVWVTE